ncbi:cytosolic leucyl tRNA synthetase [Botryosphaeria dothidea]
MAIRKNPRAYADKRDSLVAYEKQSQARWRDTAVFESNTPSVTAAILADLRAQHPKFFVNMTYPYINGTLHAGHAFTGTKTKFTVGFMRMLGKNVPFPMGF